MKSIINITFTIVALSITTSFSGQQKIDPTLEVKRDFDVNLLEIQKKKIRTDFEDTIGKFDLNFKYSIFDKPITNLYEFTPIRYARPETPATLRHSLFYSDAGINLPFNPHLDLYLQPRLPGSLSLVFYGRHNSYLDKIRLMEDINGTLSRGEEKVSAPSHTNNLGVELKYNYNGGRVGFNIDFENNRFSYYGYDQERDQIAHPMPDSYMEIWEPVFQTLPRIFTNSFLKDTLSHRFDSFFANAFLESANGTRLPFYYRASFQYGYLKDRPSYRPMLSSVPAQLINDRPDFEETYFSASGALGYIFATHHRFVADISYQASNSVASNSLDRYDLEIHPHYVFNRGKWIFEIGLKFNKYVDPSMEAFNIFFSGNLSYKVADNILWLYASADGRNNFRNYRGMLRENPWITSNIEVKNTEEPLAVRAGARGQVSDRLSFNIWGGYNKYTNFLTYIHMSDIWAGPLNTFWAMYKDMYRYGFGGELSWKSKNFEAGTSFEYSSYKNRDSSTVYNLPPFQLKGFARYNYRSRIFADASIHYRSGSPTLLYFHPYTGVNAADQSKIQPFTMLNLGITYAFNRKISYYFLINNILNTNESYYPLYGNPGTGIGAGIKLNL